MRIILIVFMTVSGMRGLVAVAGLVDELLRLGRATWGDVVWFVDMGVIFWLAACLYGAIIRLDAARVDARRTRSTGGTHS